MYGFKVDRPWILFIVIPLLDFIFVSLLNISSKWVSLEVLPLISIFWLAAVIMPETRSYPNKTNNTDIKHERTINN